MKHFTLTDRFIGALFVGIFAKALHRGDTEVDAGMPVVRNGELRLDNSAWDAELPWDQWLQNLPKVDGWTSTASWEAQHGRAAMPKGGVR
ncbi:hypothetical protein ACQP1O_42860 (plasmid) [Nocardia sp. CA-151230]|uniref:hypothetical protein n=1 Tax=Nocardia sp. CA-151230 TaxID=3239982 RepID=UPI003D8A57E4